MADVDIFALGAGRGTGTGPSSPIGLVFGFLGAVGDGFDSSYLESGVSVSADLGFPGTAFGL